MRNIRALSFAVMFSAGISSPLLAEPVTFQVHGTIDSFVRGGVVDQIPLGSPFQMTMTWETDTPVSSSTATLATYYGALTNLEAHAADLSFYMSPGDGSSSMSVGNGPDFDSLVGSLTDSTTTSDSDLGLWLTRWELLFPADTWTGTLLPATAPAFFDSGMAKLTMYSRVDGHDVTVQASLTSVNSIPEPSTLALFGIGILGAVRLGRKGGRSSIESTQT